MSYFHGILVNEPVDGIRPSLEKSSAVIGLIATAPDAPAEVKAKLLTGVVASNNAQTFTAKPVGVLGNAISLTITKPSANSQALSVSVTGKAISVSLATSAGGAATTTAAQLKTAIEGNADANALIGVANQAGSSGAGVVPVLAKTSLAGGADEPFPLDTPVLVTDVRRATAMAGTLGTLKNSLLDIAEQGSPLTVVVRVAVATGDEEDPTQDDLVIGAAEGGYTGVQALLVAERRVGVSPAILGAPGLDTEAVANALASVGQQLLGEAYAHCRGADGALVATRDAAVAHADKFGQRELMLIWPDFTGWDGQAVAIALGKRAAIDQRSGWHDSLSNYPVNGVTGITHDVSYNIGSTATDANVLNQANVTTLIQSNGFKFWGLRTCSAEPMFAFEVATRTAQAIQRVIADAEAPFIGRPMTVGLARSIVETANMKLGNWTAVGRLMGGQSWLEDGANPPDQLLAGRLSVEYDYGFVSPLEGMTLNQRVTGRYYLGFADKVNG